jgi:hypothetical protein
MNDPRLEAANLLTAIRCIRMTSQNNSLPQFPVLLQEPECVCCAFLDHCDAEPGTVFRITRDVRKRSNCDGNGFDAWDDIDGEVDY